MPTFTWDLGAFLRDSREREQADRWEYALSGICPYCQNARGRRYDDHETGEIEWVPCHFCISEADMEAEA